MGQIQVVIAGAGFGGMKVFNHLTRLLRERDNVGVTLVNNVNYFLFTPLLHEVATGSLGPEDIIVPLPSLLQGAGQRFLAAQALAVERRSRQLKTTAGDLPYDYLILALGSGPYFYDVPGARQWAWPLKDLDDAVRLKNHLIGQFEKAQNETEIDRRRELLTFVVVGGGATGVELAGELSDFIYRTFRRFYPPAVINAARIILLQREPAVLPQFSPGIRRRSLAALGRKGVEVLVNTAVVAVEERQVELSTGERLPTETVIWTAGVWPHELPAMPSLPAERGRLLVNDYLQTEDPRILALGDMALMPSAESSKGAPLLAQAADQAAAVAAKNILSLIDGRPLVPFSFRSRGNLVSLGNWWAAGEVGGLHFAGRMTWLLWRAVYWFKMPSLRKKLEIGLDWLINAFTPRDVSLLPFTNQDLHQ